MELFLALMVMYTACMGIRKLWKRTEFVDREAPFNRWQEEWEKMK